MDRAIAERCIWKISRVVVAGIILLLTLATLHYRLGPEPFLLSHVSNLHATTNIPDKKADNEVNYAVSPSSPQTAPLRNVSTEKYITLLAPVSPHPWDQGQADEYFETATIMAHRLLHNPETKDPFGRGFIVLTTHDVKPKQIAILQDLGAEVRVIDVIPPPSNVNTQDVYYRSKDQYTKLLMWNMTELTRIVYIDADSIIIKTLSELFDIQPVTKGSEEWLFASVYDAGPMKGFGSYPNDLPVLEPDDKWGWNEFSGGQFLLMPTQAQSEYVFSLYNNPPPGTEFQSTTEQAFLRYAYRDGGPYPWVRLSQIYNTQRPRAQDMLASKVIHEKSWDGGPNHVEALKEEWHRGWGDVQGYLALKQGMDEYAREAHPIKWS